MEKQNKSARSRRRSIREWIGDSNKDYGEIQRRFLKVPLNDYCRYLEMIFRDGRGQEIYEEIQEYTGIDGDTDMNHVLRTLVNVCTNTSKYGDASGRIHMYSWGIRTIYDLLIAPFPYQPMAEQVDKIGILAKISQAEEDQNLLSSNKKGE